MNNKIVKSNNSNQEYKKCLLENNYLLRPDKLVDFNNSYRLFSPISDYSKLWLNKLYRVILKKRLQRNHKYFILFSGISAGGKDAVRERIQALFPKMIHKLVTATSRRPRPGETEGTDYYFYPSNRAFLEAAKSNIFLSYTPVCPKTFLYGLPFRSIQESFEHPEPFICSHSDIRAWPELQDFTIRYCKNMNIPVSILKVFVLPDMSAREYFNEWLPAHRSDYQKRSLQSAYEIQTASDLTDIIIQNPIHGTQHSITDVATSFVSFLKK